MSSLVFCGHTKAQFIWGLIPWQGGLFSYFGDLLSCSCCLKRSMLLMTKSGFPTLDWRWASNCPCMATWQMRRYRGGGVFGGEMPVDCVLWQLFFEVLFRCRALHTNNLQHFSFLHRFCTIFVLHFNNWFKASRLFHCCTELLVQVHWCCDAQVDQQAVHSGPPQLDIFNCQAHESNRARGK